MLRIDRLSIYIIIFGLIFLIPSVQYITFTDELFAYSLGLLAMADSIINNNWRKYTLLWILVGLITCYGIYSLTAVHFTSARAIFRDWLIQLKPFLPFAVLFGINPSLTETDRKLIRNICYFNGFLLGFMFLLGWEAIKLLVFHPTYGSVIIFISAMFILLVSSDKEGQLPINVRNAVVILLTLGLLSLKAKYYGTYILSIYFLLVYKPGMFRKVSPKHIVGVLIIVALILLATWHKISYYFLYGNSETFDPTMTESFARPVLYMTGFMILADYFPFGTGLASFATDSSNQTWAYSGVYYEYGIDRVHGLAPGLDFNFVNDTHYPSLAQFGIVGVILFFWFWIYAYSFLKYMIRFNPEKYKTPFIVGSLIICFILIESVAANTFTGGCGAVAMMLLGLVCAKGKALKQTNRIEEQSIQLAKIKI